MKYKELTQNISGSLKTLAQDSPDLMKSFNQLSQVAMRDGVIDPKTKELIALAIGVAARCDGCIGFHVRTLVKMGMTLQELEEVLGVAVYMGGGPSLMYAANALEAFKEFTAQFFQSLGNDMNQHWDNLYSQTQDLYGISPNHFIQQIADQVPIVGKTLAIAEGEGRNILYLARISLLDEGCS